MSDDPEAFWVDCEECGFSSADDYDDPNDAPPPSEPTTAPERTNAAVPR
jgi:hypothetical protein